MTQLHAVAEPPSAEERAPATGDVALAIDAAAIAAVSVAICAASHRLAFMTLFLPVVIVLRFATWRSLSPDGRRGSLPAEIAFFAICTVLGAVNDWNSVVRHRIYDYDVPADLPSLTTIPFWMLLYWGMILRTAATVSQWRRLSPLEQPRNDVHFGRVVVVSRALKVFVLVMLVVITRQLIYRYVHDPVLSWLPFVAALLVYAMLFRPGRREMALAGLAVIGGPAIEMVYIHVGRLHHYELGWFGGVPLWIVLWWVLAMWVWSDLSIRLLTAVRARGTGAAR